MLRLRRGSDWIITHLFDGLAQWLARRLGLCDGQDQVAAVVQSASVSAAIVGDTGGVANG